MQELQAGAIRGSLWTTVHVAVSMPLAFLGNIVVARVLGVVDYGRLGLLSTVMMLATTMASLGVGAALMQFGAKAYGAGRTAELRSLISGAQGYNVLFAAPLVASAVVLMVRVEPWLLVLALVFGIFFPAFLQSAPAVLAMQNRSDLVAKLAMVGNVVTQLVVVLVVLTLGTPDAVWSGRIVAAGVLMLLPLLVLNRDLRRAVLRPRVPWTLPRRFWAFAIPTGLATLISTLVTDRTQVIFLDLWSDPVALGLFSLAFGLAAHISAPAQAFIGPLLPALSALTEVHQDAAKAAFMRATRCASVMTGGFVVAGLLSLAVLVPMLYGAEYAASSSYLVAMGCAGAVAIATAPHFAFLMARLGGKRYLMLNVLALVIGVLVAVALIPGHGAWGAVASFVAGTSVRALSFSVSEVSYLRLGARAAIRAGGAVLVAVTICIGLWFGLGSVVAISGITWAVLLPTIGMVLYVVVVRLIGVGFSHDDLAAILVALPRVLAAPAGVVAPVLVSRRAQT